MGRTGLPQLIADLLALWLAIVCAYYLRFLSGIIPIIEVQPFSLYVNSVLLVTPLYVFLLFTMGNYHRRQPKLNQYLVQNLLRSILFFYLLCGLATFLIHSQDHSRLTIALSLLFNILFCLIFRALILKWRMRCWRKGIDVERILLVGKDAEMLEKFNQALSIDPDESYQIVKNQLYSNHRPIESEAIDRVLLIGDFTFSDIADVLLETTEDVRVDFIPTYYVFLRTLPFREQIGSFPVLPLNRKILSDWSSVSKRLMDVTLASIILILFSPLMILITLLIRFSYGAPILYRQKRVGQNGGPFQLYKFRTMKLDAEKDVSQYIASEKQTIFKWKDDPRVENALARFLRKTGLDELPQLWNVLDGTMSLVGPRPATTELVRNYSAEHKLRLAIPPGITGLQQVHCRGSDSMEEVLKYDLQYISQQSLLLDLYILTRTVSTLLLGKGTS